METPPCSSSPKLSFQLHSQHPLCQVPQWESLKTPLLDLGALEDPTCGLFPHVLGERLGPRRGTLRLGGQVIPTPIFMPVGTLGTVKALSPQEVWDMGYRLILANTYHLSIRPGVELLEAMGGLCPFMGWPGALLTDSGGFQVMSLAKIRTIQEDGVTFANHLNGSKLFLSPESAVALQDSIGSHIQMVFDECAPYPASPGEVKGAMERSMRWAKRARDARTPRTGAQFGIVQGGMDPHLRKQSAHDLLGIGFEGYAIGGLSVGEPPALMRKVLGQTLPWMPKESPRYLMGVGAPEDLIDGVLLGVDMFDCVLPTRNARNGSVFVRSSAHPRARISIKNSQWRQDPAPLDPKCRCYTCQNFSKAYLRHLFVSSELLVLRLLTLHNLQFLADLMADLRAALDTDNPWEKIQIIKAEYTASPAPSL